MRQASRRAGRLARGLVLLALLPAGTLAGHSLAYATPQHHHPGLPHGYLRFATWLVAPLALAALGWAARQGATRSRCRLPVPLVLAQPLVFVAQETTEHLLAGEQIRPLLDSPLLGWGLVFQVLTATVLLVASSGARLAGAAVAEAWRRARFTLRQALDQRGPVTLPVPRTSQVSPSASGRGPPFLLVLA